MEGLKSCTVITWSFGKRLEKKSVIVGGKGECEGRKVGLQLWLPTSGGADKLPRMIQLNPECTV
jgi:hypothetical protein